MKIKLNAPLTIDSNVLNPGEHDLTPQQVEAYKNIDIKGMPIVTKEQIPLITIPGDNVSDED